MTLDRRWVAAGVIVAVTLSAGCLGGEDEPEGDSLVVSGQAWVHSSDSALLVKARAPSEWTYVVEEKTKDEESWLVGVYHVGFGGTMMGTIPEFWDARVDILGVGQSQPLVPASLDPTPEPSGPVAAELQGGEHLLVFWAYNAKFEILIEGAEVELLSEGSELARWYVASEGWDDNHYLRVPLAVQSFDTGVTIKTQQDHVELWTRAHEGWELDVVLGEHACAPPSGFAGNVRATGHGDISYQVRSGPSRQTTLPWLVVFDLPLEPPQPECAWP